MKEKSRSILKRTVTILMIMEMVCSSLFATGETVHAGSLSLDEKTSYQYNDVSPIKEYIKLKIQSG